LLNCSEAKFTTVSLVDYTATTLNVDKFSRGTLEVLCLPLGEPHLVNVFGK